MEDNNKNKMQLTNKTTDLQQKNIILEKTKDKRKEETENLLLKMALDYFPLGITIKDVTGQVIYTNFAEAEIHGYKVEEIINKEARMFAPRKLWKPLRSDQVNNWRHWTRESLNISKDGKEFPVQLSSNLIRNEKGIPVGIITTCEDITNRKQLEESLEASKEELQKRVIELEEFYAIAIDRELRMVALKKEIERLNQQLEQYGVKPQTGPCQSSECNKCNRDKNGKP